MSDRAIKEAIETIAGGGRNARGTDRVAIVAAEVDSVDISTRTIACTPISGQAVSGLINVQLMAEVDDGVLVVPKVGSTVFVAYSTFNPPFVVLFSEVESMVLLGGEHGGLVKVVDLVDRLNKVENKVNALLSKFNSLVSSYNSHTHTGVQTGGGTSGPTANTSTPESGTLTLTARTDVENTQITHGS